MFTSDRFQHSWQVINRSVEHVSNTDSMDISKNDSTKCPFPNPFNCGSVFSIPLRPVLQVRYLVCLVFYTLISLQKLWAEPVTTALWLKHITKLFIYGNSLSSLQRTNCMSQLTTTMYYFLKYVIQGESKLWIHMIQFLATFHPRYYNSTVFY